MQTTIEKIKLNPIIAQILIELEMSKKLNKWGISVYNYNNGGIVNIPQFKQEQ